jgi:2'-5' RNA ligase
METYQKEPEHDGDDDDAMEILTQDLHLTVKFLGRLRTHEVDPASGSFAAQQTSVRKIGIRCHLTYE